MQDRSVERRSSHHGDPRHAIPVVSPLSVQDKLHERRQKMEEAGVPSSHVTPPNRPPVRAAVPVGSDTLRRITTGPPVSLDIASLDSCPSNGRTRYAKVRKFGTICSATSPLLRFFRILFGGVSTRVYRGMRARKRACLMLVAAALLVLLLLALDYGFASFVMRRTSPAMAAAATVWGLEDFDAPTGAQAVLVQHADAMEHLNATTDLHCAFSTFFCADARLSPQLLPSWTLHIVEKDCETCVEKNAHRQALKGRNIASEKHHAVFATSTAPLGRVGPMLFAMSSVTDEVDVAAELPKWGWMRHVYAGFAAPHTEAPPTAGVSGTPSYLAVMGVPSTDQPARVALREAQRATWLSYREVARSENGFHGALLPLYVFAAVEPLLTAAVVSPGEADNTNINGTDTATATAATADAAVMDTAAEPEANAFTYLNASSVAPTVNEFARATQARIAVERRGKTVRYTQRRVVLRDMWRTGDQSVSPCGYLETDVVDEETEPSSLSTASALMGLPVTPAFVSGAQFICYASAGLWAETLAHQNVVWVDLMTDRRPTTKKKLGEAGKWGLAVEVGMSQKLILWLEYAYHAFQDVPYIIKGDDDSYLKVPQFLWDLRAVASDAIAFGNNTAGPKADWQLVTEGPTMTPTFTATPSTAITKIEEMAMPMQRRELHHGDHYNSENQVPANRLLHLRDAKTAIAAAEPLAAEENDEAEAGTAIITETTRAPLAHPLDLAATPCIYWGSLRSFRSVKFAAGMMILLHRHMVRAVLLHEPSHHSVDVVRLATHSFNSRYRSAYRASHFNQEDTLLGLLINASMPLSVKFCPNSRVYFSEEGYARMHDLRVGKVHNVTWSTVVAHRCKPADYYYLHYFFQKEHEFSSVALLKEVNRSAKATGEVLAWLAEQKKRPPADVIFSDLEAFPATTWLHRMSKSPAYNVDPVDRVAVYKTVHYLWQNLPLAHSFGYASTPKR